MSYDEFRQICNRYGLEYNYMFSNIYHLTYRHPIFGDRPGLIIKYHPDWDATKVYLYEKLFRCSNDNPHYYTVEESMYRLQDLDEATLTKFLDERMRKFDELLPKVEREVIELSSQYIMEQL